MANPPSAAGPLWPALLRYTEGAGRSPPFFGLPMLDDFSNDSHQAEVALPSFGSLCARALRLARLDPLLLASAKQRAWIEAANAALGALHAGGALTRGYSFIAYDERQSLAPLNFLLSSSAERYGQPRGPSFAHSLSAKPSRGALVERLRALGASRESRASRPGFESMASAFGGAERARVFAVAHEFGHSWHAAHDFPWTRAAAQRAGAPFAEPLSRLCDLYGEPGGPDTASKAPEQLLRGLWEECAADAIACWTLSRALPGPAIEQAIAFRSEPCPNPSLPHQTAWFLKALQALGPLAPLPFDAFCERARTLFAQLSPAASRAFSCEPPLNLGARPNPRSARPG